MPPAASLEIVLRRVDAATLVDLCLTPPGGQAPAQLIAGDLPRLHLDLGPLRAAALDTGAYGALLSQALFADPRVAAGYREARALAAGAAADLRLQLRIPAAAQEQAGGCTVIMALRADFYFRCGSASAPLLAAGVKRVCAYRPAPQ